MVFAGDEGMVLASVKAVSDDYPLRGAATQRVSPTASCASTVGGPAPRHPVDRSAPVCPAGRRLSATGRAWARRISRVAAAIRGEPDRSGGFLGVGPRVMLHVDDIPATGVVQPGSRVSYRQLFAGDTRTWFSRSCARLEEAPGAGAAPAERRDCRSRRWGGPCARGAAFCCSPAASAVILAGVAISLAARRYSERHQNYVALLKSLGAPVGRVRRTLRGDSAVSWRRRGARRQPAGPRCCRRWRSRRLADQLTVRPVALLASPGRT
jgi:putative ABC transport system permease protein